MNTSDKALNTSDKAFWGVKATRDNLLDKMFDQAAARKLRGQRKQGDADAHPIDPFWKVRLK